METKVAGLEPTSLPLPTVHFTYLQYLAIFLLFAKKAYAKVAKIFTNIFVFTKVFVKIFGFAKVFAKIFHTGMRIRIQEPPECVSTSETLVENSVKIKIFPKSFEKAETFCENHLGNKNFLRKQKFAYFCFSQK
jgi:predicted membrane protein